MLAVIKTLIPTILGAVAAAIGIPEESRDIAVWAGSAAALAPIVGGAVSHLRKHVWPGIQGWKAPLFSVGVGSGFGTALGWGTNLIPGGLVEWVAFGATAGLIASYGVDLTRSLFKAQPVMFAPSSAANAFILDFVRGLLPAVKLPAGMQAVAELLAQFAQSELVLTDDLRADLQKRVLAALRKAGVVGVDV